MDRRNFVRLSSLAAAGGLLNGCSGSTPAGESKALAAPPPTPLKQVKVEIHGGLALVFTKTGSLEVGSVMMPVNPPEGCALGQHGMRLFGLKGSVVKDETGLALKDGSGNPKNIWNVSGRFMTFAGGVTSTAIDRPPDGSGDMPVSPADDAGWNDLAWVFAPTRHHHPSSLRQDWRAHLHGRMVLPGGAMTVDKPEPDCGSKGVWEYRDQSGSNRFKRTIADRFTVTMAAAGTSVTLEIGGKPLTFAADTDGTVTLRLAAKAADGFEYGYKLNEPWPHVGAYYELVTASATPGVLAEVPWDKRLIPHYFSFKGKAQDCPDGCRTGITGCSPGEQCPAATFHEG